MNRGMLLENTVSVPKQPSASSSFSTSVDLMREWLVSIYHDLGQYAEALVERGYRQPEEILKLDETQRLLLANDANITHDVHKQLFIEGTEANSARNVPSSAYTTLHKANAACKNVETSTLGSYQTCITADEQEAMEDPSCTYVPIRVGDMVWAKYDDLKWAEARVVAVFKKGQLPSLPDTSNDINHWLQHSKAFFNIGSDGVDRADIAYTPFLKNPKHAKTSSTLNPQGYSYYINEVDYDTVDCVTLHIQFVKFPNKPPYDTIEKTKQTQRNQLRRKYDLRVRAQDVRRHPPQSVIDDAMLHCIKSNASGEFVTIGCKSKDSATDHSKHVFESICSETCRDVNTLNDVETSGNISSVYKKDANTLSQSMLTHLLNECEPSAGYKKAKRSCAAVNMVLGERLAGDGTNRIVPNACPCASSTLNAAEVQTFLDSHKPREFKLESRCFPKETPDELKDLPTSCQGIYDIPCRTRTKFTSNGEPFCERPTTNNKCKWYDRSEYIDKIDADRQNSTTMTGCYDADDCLFSDETSCTHPDHPNKCKWMEDWKQCVPDTTCVTEKPVTIDDFNKLIQKNEYQKIQARTQETQRIKNDNAREDTLLKKMKNIRLVSNNANLDFVNKL